jgi:hypothetical protein
MILFLFLTLLLMTIQSSPKKMGLMGQRLELVLGFLVLLGGLLLLFQGCNMVLGMLGSVKTGCSVWLSNERFFRRSILLP